MKKLSIFLIIFALTALKAYANSTCLNAPTEDKNTKKVNLIHEMPPMRDQDSIGWCYSFTTSDLLTHYLYKTNGKHIQLNDTPSVDYRLKPFNVSAMGIASMYNETIKSSYNNSLNNQSLKFLQRNKKKVVAEGGNLADAIRVAKEKGFCFEKDVSSQDFSYVTDFRCAVKNVCSIAEILNIIYESPREKIGCNDLTTIKGVFPELEIQKIASVLEQSAKQNALTNLVNATCQKKFSRKFQSHQPLIESKTIKRGESSHELMKSLDNHLDRGIPVGIMYYSDFLLGKPSSTSPHASSIVGKAFNPVTCEVEYILRNSWGHGCGYYVTENPEYKKCLEILNSSKNSITYFRKLLACRNNYKPIPRNPRVRCEEPSGYVYIRKSDLAKEIYNTTAIQEDKIF